MENKIFFTSDLHLGHNREFLYEPRGFRTSREHDFELIKNWNSVVSPNDEVYILGDLMLNDNDWGSKCFKMLNGNKFIILGNHDTEARQYLYESFPNTVVLGYADILKYKKFHFYLSHYPTFTGNNDKGSLHRYTINLFGHTHSKEKFYEDNFFMYNVALDAHNCIPVEINQIIEDCNKKFQKSKAKGELNV